MEQSQVLLGLQVHLQDSRVTCHLATVIGTAVIGVQVSETSEGKPVYEQREGVEVEVVDNGGRYNRTLLHRDRAAKRAESYHLSEECTK